VRSGTSASFGNWAADALGGDAGRFVPAADDLQRFVESAAVEVQGSAAVAAAVAAAAGGRVELWAIKRCCDSECRGRVRARDGGRPGTSQPVCVPK
jgi:hypothetical protein